MADSARNKRDMLNDTQRPKSRLLILERSPDIRDTCAKVLHNFNCDLYSTSFIENLETIVSRFEPDGLVVDVGLFDGDGIDLLELVVNSQSNVKFLFLAADDSELAESAANMARSIGLHVEGNLQRPIDKRQLTQSLERMA